MEGPRAASGARSSSELRPLPRLGKELFRLCRWSSSCLSRELGSSKKLFILIEPSLLGVMGG